MECWGFSTSSRETRYKRKGIRGNRGNVEVFQLQAEKQDKRKKGGIKENVEVSQLQAEKQKRKKGDTGNKRKCWGFSTQAEKQKRKKYLDHAEKYGKTVISIIWEIRTERELTSISSKKLYELKVLTNFLSFFVYNNSSSRMKEVFYESKYRLQIQVLIQITSVIIESLAKYVN